MEFRFINNNAPLDRHSQRLVRNHAMKGKNLGRIIPARGHKRQHREDATHLDYLTTPPTWSTDGTKERQLLPKLIRPRPGQHVALPPNPFSGAELAYFAIPVPLTSSVRYLFYEFHYSVSKELFPHVFCRPVKENETIWFERVIEDPCVFHCAMAVTRARITHSQDNGGKSSESTWHFLQALRLLRYDLGTNFSPQDSSIVVAISLAIYANLNGSTSESRIHVQGLKRILELRPGGLAALCSSAPEVGNKIRRIDVELALVVGTPTVFGSQALPLPGLLHVVPLDDRKLCDPLPTSLSETSPTIQFAVTDVTALCKYAGSAQLSAFEYQNLVISIFQRLIDFASLGGDRPSHPLDNICQLGLLAFMSTVLYHTRERRFTCSALLSDLLRTGLDRFDIDMSYDQVNTYDSLHLWLLFVYAVSAPEYEQYCNADSSVAQRIQALANKLTIETWEDIAAHLSVYPWVMAFHDEPSKKLWAVICR